MTGPVRSTLDELDAITPSCPACGAENAAMLLGQLCHRAHYRCEACGITHSHAADGEDRA